MSKPAETPEQSPAAEPLPVREPGATFRQPAATIARPEQPDWARHHAHHAFGDD